MSRNTRLTTTIIDESDGGHGRVRAAASLCFVLAAQAKKLSVSAHLGGRRKPKTPRTEQRRRCSDHRSLELSSVFSVASLGCRGTWPIELVAKLGLRPPWFFLRRHRRGTLCYDLVAVSAAVAPVATRWGSRFIASVVVVGNAHTATDRLGDVGPVRTCHMQVGWNPLLQIELLPRGRVFTRGYYLYPELMWVLHNISTRTKNFCELCTTFIPVPETSVRSVRPCHITRGTGTAFSCCGPQIWSACACVCAYASTSPAGCWREASRAWVGWANSLTGGGQNKVPRWPNKVALASWVASARYTVRKGGQRRVRSYFDQSCGSIRPQLYSVLPCTLLWPYSNKVYLVLATAQYSIPTLYAGFVDIIT